MVLRDMEKGVYERTMVTQPKDDSIEGKRILSRKLSRLLDIY